MKDQSRLVARGNNQAEGMDPTLIKLIIVFLKILFHFGSFLLPRKFLVTHPLAFVGGLEDADAAEVEEFEDG